MRKDKFLEYKVIYDWIVIYELSDSLNLLYCLLAIIYHHQGKKSLAHSLNSLTIIYKIRMLVQLLVLLKARSINLSLVLLFSKASSIT